MALKNGINGFAGSGKKFAALKLGNWFTLEWQNIAGFTVNMASSGVRGVVQIAPLWSKLQTGAADNLGKRDGRRETKIGNRQEKSQTGSGAGHQPELGQIASNCPSSSGEGVPGHVSISHQP